MVLAGYIARPTHAALCGRAGLPSASTGDPRLQRLRTRCCGGDREICMSSKASPGCALQGPERCHDRRVKSALVRISGSAARHPRHPQDSPCNISRTTHPGPSRASLLLTLLYRAHILCCVQNDLVPLLRNSKVEYLRLVIGGSYIREDRLEDELIIERWLREHLRAMNLDLLRDTLVGATTTLRVLAFTIVIRGQRVWAAERSGGTVTTIEVDPVDARELILREEA